MEVKLYCLVKDIHAIYIRKPIFLPYLEWYLAMKLVLFFIFPDLVMSV